MREHHGNGVAQVILDVDDAGQGFDMLD